MTTQSFQVNIQRYDPDREPPTYTETYQVDYHPSMTVLEVLEEIQHNQEASLAFRSSCRSSKCGTCAVSLNGKPELACRTVVNGNEITLGPLPKRAIVRDLITSQRERGKRMQQLADGEPQIAAVSLPESKIDYANVSRCIECTICTASCPVGFELEQMAPTPDLLSAAVGAGIRVAQADSPAVPVEGNIDYCSLCLNCYMACPAGVELNSFNARAKGAFSQAQKPSLRNWLFGRPDLLGKMSSLTPKLSNLALNNTLLRKGMDAAVGISDQAGMLPYEIPFQRWFDTYQQQTTPSAERKAAFFVGCFNGYNDTQPAKDTVILLDQLGVYVAVPPQQCCGMPMMGNGDLDGARRRAEANLASFQPWLEQGYDVIATCTTGSLMLKEEYPKTLGLSNAEELANRTYDLGEYLQLLVKEKRLDISKLKPVPKRISYHAPCHLKAQQIGRPFALLLNSIPGMQINILDTNCCGMSGSYGLKAEKYALGMAVGQHLFNTLNSTQPDLAVSECGSCQLQMRHGTGLPTKHPVSLLRQAVDGQKEESR
jgi:glycerol-3-phosphate dehydrogenase subunit C